MSNFNVPRVKPTDELREHMFDVEIALTPAILFGVYRFGMPALRTIILAVLTSVVAELDERFEEQYPKNDQSEERIRRKESKFMLRAVKKRNQMQCLADEESGNG